MSTLYGEGSDQYYTVEEQVGRRGNWRPSPMMLSHFERVTYSSESEAEQAIADLCERTGDEASRYRIEGVDGPPDVRHEPDRVAPRPTEQALLRMAPGYRARLAALAETEGLSAAQLVEHWIGLHERTLAEYARGR